jgi:hypothetical protein
METQVTQTTEEEKKLLEPSEEYKKFLDAVKKNGAYVRILKEVNGEKKVENFYVKKDAVEHGVTDENLLGFTPLSRKEQRRLFHTPYKFGRRMGKA